MVLTPDSVLPERAAENNKCSQKIRLFVSPIDGDATLRLTAVVDMP
jgi:hypothetical protein